MIIERIFKAIRRFIETVLFRVFGRSLIVFSVFMLIFCISVGYRYFHDEFIGNLLSEITGIFISIIIAVFIVNRYESYVRHKKWEKFRKITYGSLTTHICDLFTEIFVFFPVKNLALLGWVVSGRNSPSAGSRDAMSQLIRELTQAGREDIDGQPADDVAVEVYDEVRWILDEIRNILTPRVIQNEDDMEVINILVEFDKAGSQLHNAVVMHGKTKSGDVFGELVRMLRQAIKVYEMIYFKMYEINKNNNPKE